MTRFARANGSNERREEDATPWHVMRQQLLNQSKNEKSVNNEDLSQIVKNVKSSKLDGPNEIWSDFSVDKQVNKKTLKKSKSDIETKQVKLSSVNASPQSSEFKKDSKNKHVKGEKSEAYEIKGKLKCNLENETNKDSNKKKKKNHKFNNDNNINCNNTNPNKIKNKKETSNKSNKLDTLSRTEYALKNRSGITGSVIKYPNLNEKNNNKLNNDNNINCNNNKPNIINKKKGTSNNSNKLDKISPTEDESNTISGIKRSKNTKYSYLNKKQNTFVNHKNFNSAYTIVANGREFKLIRYGGFLVKKSDAEKLKTLKKKLKSQNIPTDKIKTIMKLERRKAEKALAREKRTVCFNCRKSGHNFADCPDSKESEMSQSGMCFKCGSTEHTHFECKVSHNENFRFAVCFVCKEQGHIAKQCTLNPQGQYPKGGCCHMCGEVTHLRRDCPKAVELKPNNTLTIDRLKDGQSEDIDEVEVTTKKNKKKIVTF